MILGGGMTFDEQIIGFTGYVNAGALKEEVSQMGHSQIDQTVINYPQ